MDPESDITITPGILLVIYFTIETIKFLYSLFVENQKNSSQKDLLREQRRIKVVEELYSKLDSLSLLDDQSEVLNETTAARRYLKKNRLFISKKLDKISQEIIDYHLEVLSDESIKDVKIVSDLFNKFIDEFNH